MYPVYFPHIYCNGSELVVLINVFLFLFQSFSMFIKFVSFFYIKLQGKNVKFTIYLFKQQNM